MSDKSVTCSENPPLVELPSSPRDSKEVNDRSTRRYDYDNREKPSDGRDGVLRGQAAIARRFSSARPRRFSRKSNSPAHSELRSGRDSQRTAEESPSSARTSTASSRYAAATRCGATRTPARPRMGSQSTSSAVLGSPNHDRP